jgi:hypothetical protein
MRNAYKNLVGKREGKGTLSRSRCRKEDNIRMDLTETGWEDVDWMHLVQDRDQWLTLIKTVMNLYLLTYLLVLFVPTGT